MQSRTSTFRVALRLLAGLAALAACGGPAPGPADGFTAGSVEQAFINGEDDRREYFELTDPAQQALMEQSVVALVRDTEARLLNRGELGELLTWGESYDLCPDEPFVDQPSAAFCSGVLVDWDLVLTSGHCVGAFPLRSVRVVFGFYFRQPGELALRREDFYQVEELVVARDDDGSADVLLDFAWLRLSEPVQPPHAPAPLRARPLEVELGDAILSINAGGGVPLKLDAGARVRDVRAGVEDYFVADTDTSEGSSGGAAFNADLAVVGTLARGAPDFVPTAAGCAATDREPNPLLAREQFTYAHRSVEGLCEVEPSHWLCDAGCDANCEPPPPPTPVPDPNDGCVLGPPAPHGSTPHAAWFVLACATALARSAGRRRSSSGQGPRGV